MMKNKQQLHNTCIHMKLVSIRYRPIPDDLEMTPYMTSGIQHEKCHHSVVGVMIFSSFHWKQFWPWVNKCNGSIYKCYEMFYFARKEEKIRCRWFKACQWHNKWSEKIRLKIRYCTAISFVLFFFTCLFIHFFCMSIQLHYYNWKKQDKYSLNTVILNEYTLFFEFGREGSSSWHSWCTIPWCLQRRSWLHHDHGYH